MDRRPPGSCSRAAAGTGRADGRRRRAGRRHACPLAWSSPIVDVRLLFLVLLVLGLAPFPLVVPGAEGASTVTATYHAAVGLRPAPLVGVHVCGADGAGAVELACSTLRERLYPDGIRVGLVGLRSPAGDVHDSATLLVQDDSFQASYVLACVPAQGGGADTLTCADDALPVSGCTSVYIEQTPTPGEGGFGGDARPLAGYLANAWLDPETLRGCFATSGVGTVVYH